MAAPALSVTRSLCEMRNWSISNLEIQKILYIAHMCHLGEKRSPLINENFQAWEFGPVVPEVYRHTRGFGKDPVRNVFHWIPPLNQFGSEMEILRQVSDATRNMSAGQLVANTHWTHGAWYKKYQPGVRGIVIPNDLIAAEFHERHARSPSRA